MKTQPNPKRRQSGVIIILVGVVIALAALTTAGGILATQPTTPPKCPVCQQLEVKDTDGVWYCPQHVVASTQK